MINYRNVFRSKKARLFLLSLLTWVPDKLMIYIQYYLQTGKKLNLRSPETFNEKIQAYKLFYRNPQMLRCTDKVEFRDYLEEKGYANYLVPIIKIYENIYQIDFNELPNKFVIKTSDGSGANEVYICREKAKEQSKILSILKEWEKIRHPKKHIAREWAYDNHYPRRYIVETLLENEDGENDIDDFKFYCFQGKYKFLQWHKDRNTNHRAGHYDENGHFMPNVYRDAYPTFQKEEKLPGNFREMVSLAESLAKDFPFARVDLYNMEGQIYIGEITFYPASGYYTFNPENIDMWLGSFFKYPFE